MLIAVAALACAAGAHAERSLLEADQVEAGDCEIETQLSRKTARDAGPQREASVQLACGVGAGTEITAAIARRRSDDARDTAASLEGKTVLLPRGDRSPAWALEYGLAMARDAQARWRRGDGFVAIEASWHPAPGWATEAKLGTLRQRAERRNATTVSLAVERAIAERLEGRAELQADDRERPQLELTLRYAIEPGLATLKLSYAARSGHPRERQVGVGLAIEF
jgi:hypothetical protein